MEHINIGAFESLPTSPSESRQDTTEKPDTINEYNTLDKESSKLKREGGSKLNINEKLKVNKSDFVDFHSNAGSKLENMSELMQNEPLAGTSNGIDCTVKTKQNDSNVSNLDYSGGPGVQVVEPLEKVIDKIGDINVQEEGESKDNDSNQPQTSTIYKYITEESELEPAIIEIKHKIREKSDKLALDVEGYKLSRAGTITLVSIATSADVYLFDVLKLGKSVFDKGLKSILEDKEIDKLMFDCREDSDALWHLFDVKLDGILDIQLLEVMSRSTESHGTSSSSVRNQRVNEVDRLESLIACVYNYLKDYDTVRVKQRVADKIEQLKNVWEERPLTDEFLMYAAYDVKTLYGLFDVFKPDEEDVKRLRIASDLYSRTKRDMVMRRYNEYEHNPYLPLDIIPPKGRTCFVQGNTKCTGCLRLFPYDEFTKTQLRKHVQLCRVCKMVKSHKDGQCPYIPSSIGRVPIVDPKPEQKPTNLADESRDSKMPTFQAGSLYDPRNSVFRRTNYDYYYDDSDSEDRYWDHEDDYYEREDFRGGYVYENGLRECERGFDTGSGEWMYSYD